MTKSTYFPSNSFHFLLFALCFVASLPLFAANTTEDQLYEVEVLIFSHKSNNESEAKTAEIWPNQIQFPRFDKSRDFLSPYEYLMEHDQLDESQYVTEPMEDSLDDLDKYAEKLENSKQFELIVHRKWRQFLESKKQSKPVFIVDSGKDYLYQDIQTGLASTIVPEPEQETSAEQELLNQLLNEEQLLNRPVQEQADFISDMDPIEPFDALKVISSQETVQTLELMGPPQHKVYGLFQVFKSRHPHLSFNLFYKYEEIETEKKEPSNAELFPMQVKNQALEENKKEETMDSIEQEIIEQNKTPIPALQLKASSRIRINELHYFDHPRFGVIARVRKYEPPEEENKN